MIEELIDVFVSSLMRYLSHIPGVDANIDTPFLLESDKFIHDELTGIISISGEQKGVVYFTAPRAFLSHLSVIFGIKDHTTENLLDLAGEIANTISGNVRSDFGDGFHISVPSVFEGMPQKLYLFKHKRSFAVPIHWKSYTALLVVSIE